MWRSDSRNILSAVYFQIWKKTCIRKSRRTIFFWKTAFCDVLIYVLVKRGSNNTTDVTTFWENHSQYPAVCLSVYLSIYLPTYLSIYLSTYLPSYLPIYLSIYLCVWCLYSSLVYLPSYLFIDLFHLFVRLLLNFFDLPIYMPSIKDAFLAFR